MAGGPKGVTLKRVDAGHLIAVIDVLRQCGFTVDVVDDTIHILYALNRGRGKQTNRGVQRVLQKVFPGVLTTTATLGFGFALLMFSGFAVNQQLGFLTAATIFIAFLFDLFVLPGLYIIFIGRNRKH